jgi:hypothetical protein
MPTETLVLDPTIEDAGNVPLDLLASPYFVNRFQTPTPALDVRWGEPVDADGEPIAARRYRNRRITIEIDIVAAPGATRSADAQAALAALAMKVAKVNREGGTLRRVLPADRAVTFDLLAQPDEIDPSWDVDWDTASVIRLQIGFIAKPFGRGDEEARSVHRETTLPALTFTETAIGGDAPAAARLVIKDDQGVDQRWCVWGLQVLTYDAASTAGLFYEAESCTPLAGAAVASLAGASGGGVVTSAPLSHSWIAVLSTQQTGGAHLTHVGEYRVLARLHRPWTNRGAVSVAFQWSSGDLLSPMLNDAVSFAVDELEDQLLLTDLGIVAIPPAPQGAQRWEGRIIAKTTWDGDQVSVDSLLLVPTERSGEIAGTGQIVTPTAFLGYDTFPEADGVALATQSATVGGRWSGAGDADDFVGQSGNIQRFATGDTADTGRYAILGSTVAALIAVEADVNKWGHSARIGVFARYVDTSNWLMAAFVGHSRTFDFDTNVLKVLKRVAGRITELGSVDVSDLGSDVTVRLLADTDGSWLAWSSAAIGGNIGSPLLSGIDADLVTGGVLDDGKFGIYEESTYIPRVGEEDGARGFSAFRAWTPTRDGAILAGQQLQVLSSATIRNTADGSAWAPVSRYEGDYLTIPPAGAEGRTARFIVKASRNVPGSGPDSGIDDISAQLFVTPRYLVVP